MAILRIFPVFLLLLLTCCVMKTEDAKLDLRRDLSAGISFVVSLPTPDKDKLQAAVGQVQEWRKKVQSCGGRARDFTTADMKAVRLAGDFSLADEREKDIMLLCLLFRSDQASATYTKKEGWLSDEYKLSVLIRGDPERGRYEFLTILPERLWVQMPGAISSVTDSSVLPWHRSSWRRPSGNLAVLDSKPLEQTAFEARKLSKTDDIPPMKLEFVVKSKVNKLSTIEALTVLGALAAILPLVPWLIRLARRIWKRRREPPASNSA